MGEFIRTDTNEILISKLLGCIGRLHSNRTDQAMEHLGLYRGQAMMLLTISRNDGLTHSELAERLNISPAAATKVIKRLEVLHYVKRQADPNDDRISRVFLEKEGWAVIEQIIKVFIQIDHTLWTGFTPEEQNTLYHFLLRLFDNLSASNAEGQPTPACIQQDV